MNGPALKGCSICGQAVDVQAVQCPRCGHPFPAPGPYQQAPGPQGPYQQPPYQQPHGPYQQPYGQYPPYQQAPSPYGRPAYGAPDSNKLLITLLLWFFLGGFGAHRMFLGHMGSGIAMLVLTVVGIMTACILIGYIPLLIVSIWAIIDLILILTGSLRPVDGTRII